MTNPASAQLVKSDAHYSYATLFGTGVYRLDDRTVAVLRIPFGWQFREATLEKPGIRLAIPTAIGLHDFDLERNLIPDPEQLATISVAPGIQLQYLVGERWLVTPQAYLGFGADMTSSENAFIYGGGVSALYTMKIAYPEMHFGTAALLAGYNERNSNRDNITRWSAGVDALFPTDFKFGDGNVFIGGHLIGYFYLNPLEFDTIISEPIEIDRELEIGVFIGARPAPKIFGIEIDRLGVGYRFSAQSDAITFFASFPF